MDVFETAYRRATTYRSRAASLKVRPERSYLEMRETFAAPLPETGTPDHMVIEELADLGEPGLMQATHPRFFGWVIGGSAPVAVAADWLVSAWGQNAAMQESSPAAAAVEETAAGWLLEILDLPRTSAVGFVSGATVGSFTCLAAARGALLQRYGWDVEALGLYGAPEVQVFVGDDIHTSVLSALRYLGFGAQRLIRVETDQQGRMLADDLDRKCAAVTGAKLIIAQAGQINTGAFDPYLAIADIARRNDAWLHVDGAFGLWARADTELRHLTRGVEMADSWAVDGHKWLQVPFDSGYAIVRNAQTLQNAMTISASYLPVQQPGARVPALLVPELSRRARGVPTWAMLKSRGRSGIIRMIRQHCEIARQIAHDMDATPGIEVMNDVVLNQIILRFGHDHHGPDLRKAYAVAVIDRLVREGLIFVAGGAWRGEWIMRISVICDNTTLMDANTATNAIRSAWTQVSAMQASIGSEAR